MTGVAALTVSAVTANVADVWPCGMVTVAGAFAPAGDELIPIVAPPLNAAKVSEAEQVEPEDGLIEIGLQVNPFKVGVWTIVTVPPVADVAIAAPVESAETPLLSWTGEDVSAVEAARVRVTEATTLFGIARELSPHTRQVAVPALLLQDRVLFADAAPAAKVADVKSVVE